MVTWRRSCARVAAGRRAPSSAAREAPATPPGRTCTSRFTSTASPSTRCHSWPRAECTSSRSALPESTPALAAVAVGRMNAVPLPTLERRRPRWWVQLFVVVGFAVGYDQVRALHGDVAAAAFAHGRSVLHVDRALRLSWAEPMNHWLDGHEGVAQLLSSYYFVMHLGMTALVLLLLWLRTDGYRRHRDVLIVASLVGLVVYWLYPVAPPRMLPGFDDTVRSVLPAAFNLEAASANLYAALPSLHMAWALWCGVALWMLSARWWVRFVAVAHPLMTAVTVLATGNHYTLDLLTGAMVMALAYPLTASAALLGSELRERRVAKQQALDADVGPEVDLRLRLLGDTSNGDHASQTERVVRHAVTRRQVEDRAQTRAGGPTAADRLVSGDL